MIKQDTLENQAKSIYLGIGSNLGNRIKNIEKAKYKLFQNQINIVKSSNYYESLSWPNIKKPKFLNIVLEIETNLSELNLLNKCLMIEKQLGRKRSLKNAPRVCDIDIIDFNRIFLKKRNLQLPHPRLHERNFVLFPLKEISPMWEHPVLNRKINYFINKLNITSHIEITRIQNSAISKLCRII